MAILRFIALVTVVLWGMIQAKEVLIPLCLAALLAFLLTPGVRFLKRHRFPEGLALFLAALLILAPLSALCYEALIQGESLAQELPSLVNSIKKEWDLVVMSPLGTRFHLSEKLNSATLFDQFSQSFGAGVGVAMQGIKALLSASGELILVIVFSLLMLGSRERLKRSSELILRQSKAFSISASPGVFVETLAQLIQRFLWVRLGIALFVAGVDWIILSFFGMPYALVAGAVLGVSTLIPVVGFLLGVIPTLIIAPSSGFSFLRTVILLATLGTISGFEGHLLTPKLLGKHLNLNLLFTFLGIFVGERLWGGWGMFLSIPILGILRIVLMSAPESVHWGGLLAEKESEEILKHRTSKHAA